MQFYTDLQELVGVKFEGLLGPNRAAGDVSEVLCLNKISRWMPDNSIQIEADPRRAEIMLRQLGLLCASAKAVVTPGIKPSAADLGEPLLGEAATEFRSLVMRAAYLAEDRPDIRYAAKEAARLMSEPCEKKD